MPSLATVTAPKPTDGKELHAYLESHGYLLLEELGRGGMGVVYKAKQKGLNRFCALKIIKPDRLDQPNLKSRFLREVQAAAKLSHPNIVTVFHTNLDGPVLFLAMEYVPGTTLAKVIHQGGALAPEVAIRYAKQVAEGLQHAHEQGMVHRDIKPGNLMVTPWPLPAGKKATVKILDMGLARSIDTEDTEMGLTQNGELLGTPDFMSPEQAEDPRLVDIRSDLYSLGGTLFVLVTGRMMFDATTMVQKLKKHLLEVPPLAHTVRPNVPPALSAVIAKLLEKSPGDRYQTPQELIEALEEIEAGRGSAGGKVGQSIPQPVPTPTPVIKSPDLYTGHSGAVYAIAVASNGKFLISGGSDESIHVWDVESRRAMKPLPNIGGPVVAVGISPDNKTAATAAARLFEDANQVDVWDVPSGKFLGRLRGMKNPIQCLAFSPDGRKVAAGAEDGAVLVWTLDGKTPTIRLPGHKSNVTAIQFLAGGERVLTACRDGSLALWEVATGTVRGAMPGTVGPIRGMASSGSRIALAGNQLRLRHGDGSFVNFSGHHGPMECVAISPGRRHLLAGGNDGSVLLWQVDLPTPVEEFPRHPNKTRAVAFASDGKSIFSAGDDGLIRRCYPKTPGLI